MARRLTQHILPMPTRLIGRLLVIWIGCFSATAVAAPGRTSVVPSPRSTREVGLARIVSVVKDRVPDRELLEKAQAKLLSLSDRQVRIATALAERIAEEGHGAVAETAFLLLTVLIIFS